MTVFKQRRNLPEFDRELKKLLKKFRTLEEDIENLIDAALKMYHKLGQQNYDGIERIDNLGIEYPHILKVTKFACKALKGRGVKSGIRIIYAYFPDEDLIEFVEIYFKTDKEVEDRERIKQYYKK